MHTLQKKECKVIVSGKIDYKTVGTGHRVMSGAGKHDKRPNRLRTRNNNNQAALADW